MSYLDWHVGMKVVCVKEGCWTVVIGAGSNSPKPKYGEICTIAKIDVGGGRAFIAVEGYHQKDWFCVGHFRPLQKRTTSIEVFKALLNPTRETA